MFLLFYFFFYFSIIFNFFIFFLKISHCKKERASSRTRSFFVPIIPGFKLEVKRVVEFKMTPAVKQQLQKSMQMYPIRRVESYIDKSSFEKNNSNE